MLVQATLGQAMLRQATLRQANALAGHTHLCLVSLVTPRGHAQVSKTCLGRQAGENQAHKGHALKDQAHKGHAHKGLTLHSIKTTSIKILVFDIDL